MTCDGGGDNHYECDCNFDVEDDGDDRRRGNGDHDMGGDGDGDGNGDSQHDECCECLADGDDAAYDCMATFVRVTISPLLLFLTGSGDCTVRLWDVSTRREVAVLEGHLGRVTSVAFDGSGKYLASGGARGVTCDWGVCIDNYCHCNDDGDVYSDGDGN